MKLRAKPPLYVVVQYLFSVEVDLERKHAMVPDHEVSSEAVHLAHTSTLADVASDSTFSVEETYPRPSLRATKIAASVLVLTPPVPGVETA
jgi:hypothetical protein